MSGGAQRLKVPLEEQDSWSERFSALDLELSRRREGYREAALAHLSLLLVEVSRLAADVVGDFRLKDEPLLAAVFGFIEERYGEPISLKDVARAVGLSAGHLTTVVGRKTGRTVLEWITERRMAEARKLLVGTDLPVEEVGRRVGYGDAGYFARTFGRAHGATPLGWRRAGRPTLLRGTARRVSLRSRRQRPLTSRTVSPVSCDAPYSARHGEQEILYGPVQRVMVLHRPSSRSDGAGTPQAPR